MTARSAQAGHVAPDRYPEDAAGEHRVVVHSPFEAVAFAPFTLNGELRSHVPARIWIDKIEDTKDASDQMRILFLCEPNVITQIADKVCEVHERWDYILSHNRRVLLRCPNSIRFPYGTSWIRDYSFPHKAFGVSHMVTAANWTNGHTLRRTIWARDKDIRVPMRFFISHKVTDLESRGYVLGDSKAPLFDTQFHLAIENSSTKNYFTEKIIDCFQTKTVPIYYGAKNIGRFFNRRGIFVVRNADEAVATCNSLTASTYDSMHAAIEDNYTRSMAWLDIHGRLQRVVTELSRLWPRRQRTGYLARLWRDMF